MQQKLKGLNRGAQYGRPVLALLDLDDDPCPAGPVAALLPDKSPRMLLRVSVRSAEAWLMADREAYARHLQVPIRLVPAAPEIHRDLKSRVIGWAAEGRYARLVRQFQERRARGLMDWQILGAIQAEFIVSTWNPVRAAHAERSPSLSRALARLRELVEREAS